VRTVADLDDPEANACEPPVETAQAMAKRPARRTLGPDAIE
jgi:hypothetical protein